MPCEVLAPQQCDGGNGTCHLQPIVSERMPPNGAPPDAPNAKTIFKYPCHVPLCRKGIMSLKVILTTVVIPPNQRLVPNLGQRGMVRAMGNDMCRRVARQYDKGRRRKRYSNRTSTNSYVIISVYQHPTTVKSSNSPAKALAATSSFKFLASPQNRHPKPKTV
jgi:hypothetical protein